MVTCHATPLRLAQAAPIATDSVVTALHSRRRTGWTTRDRTIGAAEIAFADTESSRTGSVCRTFGSTGATEVCTINSGPAVITFTSSVNANSVTVTHDRDTGANDFGTFVTIIRLVTDTFSIPAGTVTVTLEGLSRATQSRTILVGPSVTAMADPFHGITHSVLDTRTFRKVSCWRGTLLDSLRTISKAPTVVTDANAVDAISVS